MSEKSWINRLAEKKADMRERGLKAGSKSLPPLSLEQRLALEEEPEIVMTRPTTGVQPSAPVTERDRAAALFPLKTMVAALSDTHPEFLTALSDLTMDPDAYAVFSAWAATSGPKLLGKIQGFTNADVTSCLAPGVEKKALPIYSTVLNQAKLGRLVGYHEHPFGKKRSIVFPQIGDESPVVVEIDETTAATSLIGMAAVEHHAMRCFPEIFEHSKPIVLVGGAVPLCHYYGVTRTSDTSVRLVRNTAVPVVQGSRLDRLLEGRDQILVNLAKYGQNIIGINDKKVIITACCIHDPVVRALGEQILELEDELTPELCELADHCSQPGPSGGPALDEGEIRQLYTDETLLATVANEAMESCHISQANRLERAAHANLNTITKAHMRVFPNILDTTASKVDRSISIAKKAAPDFDFSAIKTVLATGFGTGTYVQPISYHFNHAKIDANDIERVKGMHDTLNTIPESQIGSVIINDVCNENFDISRYDAIVCDAKRPFVDKKTNDTWVRWEENANIQRRMISMIGTVPVIVMSLIIPNFSTLNDYMEYISQFIGLSAQMVWVHPNRLHQTESWAVFMKTEEPNSDLPAQILSWLGKTAFRIRDAEELRMRAFRGEMVNVHRMLKERERRMGQWEEYHPALNYLLESTLGRIKPHDIGGVREAIEVPKLPVKLQRERIGQIFGRKQRTKADASLQFGK